MRTMTKEEERFVSVMVDATIVAIHQMQADYYRSLNNLNQTLAACVTTRELPGAEPQSIYGRRGADASLDGGPVASLKTG